LLKILNTYKRVKLYFEGVQTRKYYCKRL